MLRGAGEGGGAIFGGVAAVRVFRDVEVIGVGNGVEVEGVLRGRGKEQEESSCAGQVVSLAFQVFLA